MVVAAKAIGPGGGANAHRYSSDCGLRNWTVFPTSAFTASESCQQQKGRAVNLQARPARRPPPPGLRQTPVRATVWSQTMCSNRTPSATNVRTVVTAFRDREGAD